MDIKSIERSVKGSLAIEGVKPSKTGECITKSYLNGEITSNTAIKKIKEYHLKGGVCND